jgi:clan AA aspartic protease
VRIRRFRCCREAIEELILCVSAQTRSQSVYPPGAGGIMMITGTTTEQGTPVGIVYANITLTNPYLRKSVTVRAMVDTGTTHMIVTANVARDLGFDLEETSTYRLTIADTRRVRVPRIQPVEIRFEDRTFLTEAAVLGDECLMGVLPLEAMDLVVNPTLQCVTPNPKHPDGPVFRA